MSSTRMTTMLGLAAAAAKAVPARTGASSSQMRAIEARSGFMVGSPAEAMTVANRGLVLPAPRP